MLPPTASLEMGSSLMADLPAQPQAEVVDRAVEQARRFVAAGVDILDVGGESTRPGARTVSADEEMERVIPVVQALMAEFGCADFGRHL